jgi:nucleotide-binding universal stress UspA family protein
MSNILIAIDASKHSDYAVKWYAEHIHQPHYSVLLLHVAETDAEPAFYGRAMSPPKDDWEVIANKLRQKEPIFSMGAKHTRTLKQHGVAEVRFECVYGKPGEILVRRAAKDGCLLIVIGSRGLGSIRRTVMGSVSTYVLHHSKVAVAVCANNNDDDTVHV